MKNQGVYTSASAREFCNHFYGKAVCSHTWREWRKFFGIPLKCKILTKDQYLDLCAIAALKKGDARRIVDRAQIDEMKPVLPIIIEALSTQNKLIYIPSSLKREYEIVDGRNVQKYLQRKNLKVLHISTIYKKIPGFTIKGCYHSKQLDAIANSK